VKNTACRFFASDICDAVTTSHYLEGFSRSHREKGYISRWNGPKATTTQWNNLRTDLKSKFTQYGGSTCVCRCLDAVRGSLDFACNVCDMTLCLVPSRFSFGFQSLPFHRHFLTNLMFSNCYIAAWMETKQCLVLVSRRACRVKANSARDLETRRLGHHSTCTPAQGTSNDHCSETTRLKLTKEKASASIGSQVSSKDLLS
jgi:hypothetical protein